MALRDDIVEVVKTMAGLEERFIDLAFGLGGVDRSYVRYTADWRPTRLKLSPVFGWFEETKSGYPPLRSHSLPWLVEILNGVEHANFFEQRATEYSKAASRGGWDGLDGVWALFDAREQNRSRAL